MINSKWNYSCEIRIHLTVCKQMNSGLFKILPTNYSFIIFFNMYKQDLVLNNLHGLIFHKTQATLKDFAMVLIDFLVFSSIISWNFCTKLCILVVLALGECGVPHLQFFSISFQNLTTKKLATFKKWAISVSLCCTFRAMITA